MVFNKILTPKHAKEIKEMHNKVVNMEPCPKCREYMRQGIMFISVANGTDQRNPYRTGNICVIKDEGAKSILPPELFEQVEKRRFCFIEDEVWDKLQLPKGECKMETIEKKKLDGSDFMMGMVVDSSMRLQHKLVSLLREYEAKNIENVPVATLNQMVMESGMEAIMPGGLVSSMMKYSQKGE